MCVFVQISKHYWFSWSFEGNSKENYHQEPFAKMSGKPNRFDTIQPALSEETLLAIKEFGFEFLTPVQATSIPLFLQHKVNVILCELIEAY